MIGFIICVSTEEKKKKKTILYLLDIVTIQILFYVIQTVLKGSEFKRIEIILSKCLQINVKIFNLIIFGNNMSLT